MYTVNEITQDVTVTDGNELATFETQYINNVEVGTAVVIIREQVSIKARSLESTVFFPQSKM